MYVKYTFIFKFCQIINFILSAARNAEYGHKALEELKKEGLEPKYHQLDIQNSDSINNFANYLKQNYEGIDILINNAAILIAVYICFY
jgi:carbonyl reductase 1